MSNLLSGRPVLGLLHTATRNAASATLALGAQNRDRARLQPPGPGTRTRRAGEVSQLSRDECMRLLRTRHVGRYVYVARADRPDVVPVNYLVDDRGQIVLRSGPGPKLQAAQRHAHVAFEVDQIDEASRTGWSIVVTGRAAAVMSAEGDWLVDGPRPWAAGPRAHLIRIVPRRIEGRLLS